MAKSDAVIQIKRRPDGNGKLAHPNLVRIPKDRRLKQPLPFAGLYLNHRNIRLRVLPPHRSGKTLPVPQSNAQPRSALNHMKVGQHIAAARNHNARTPGVKHILARRRLIRRRRLPGRQAARPSMGNLNHHHRSRHRFRRTNKDLVETIRQRKRIITDGRAIRSSRNNRRATQNRRHYPRQPHPPQTCLPNKPHNHFRTLSPANVQKEKLYSCNSQQNATLDRSRNRWD